ncbi:MAG: hypothetical protein P4L56_18880 [Candidatus Sulfopaludibacter sp.]|nr:hypothetical protein [Candidatus Sulfopaludibacter sp.]
MMTFRGAFKEQQSVISQGVIAAEIRKRAARQVLHENELGENHEFEVHTRTASPEGAAAPPSG